MKKLLIPAFSLALFLALGQVVSAQVVRNATERASDRNQIAKDQATIKRDKQELAQFRGLQQGLGQAVQNGQVAMAKGYHQKLLRAMEVEVQQGQAKIKQAKGEVVGSRSEVNSERRDVNSSRVQGKPIQAADDRRDLRDDKRDLRDDKSDLAELKRRNVRQQEILAIFKAVKVDSRNDVTALWAKKNLLEEFETTMVRDMGENYEELREDKGELREDRRETREDRRQN